MNKLFSTETLLPGGLTLIRIMIGCFLMYHGREVFDRTKMNEYAAWDVFKNASSASFMVYLGKASEFATGFLMILGLLTRIASLIIIGTFIYISFFVGGGKIWYEDQYPFLFSLFGCLFFCLGPGKWSIDHLLFDRKMKNFPKS